MATATKHAPKGGLKEVPAGTDKKAKKEKKKRVLFGERDADGKMKTAIKGTIVEGFNPRQHLPLRKGDFENPADFLDWKAGRLEASAANLRKQAIDERSLGTTEQRKAAKKMKSLVERFNKAKEEMKASGMSDEQIAAFLNG